jgi:ankyrin repeat protein
MLSFCYHYLKFLLLIFLLSIPSVMNSQLVVIDTTNQYSTVLTSEEQSDLNSNLMLAASFGMVPEINWLIKNGAEIDSRTFENVTPLMFAVANNKTEAIYALLRYKPNVNVVTTYSETPLLASVKNGNIEIAEALIRDSADINQADRHGATPLHYAAIYGYFYIVDMLLYYQAWNDIKSKDGSTPLMAAIWSGFADIADLLIQNGASCEVKDSQGFTPLMLAAQNGDTIIMDLLLGKRVNMYETNNFNYDAMDISIISNQKMAVEYLFREGYKWSSKSAKSINPKSVATKFARKEITRILERNQVPENRRLGFNQVALSASVKLSMHDYFTGANLAFKEPYINGGIIAGIDFKPSYTRVLVKVNDNLFYQYHDKSSVAFAGIFKDISLTNNLYKGNWSIGSSVVAAYAFGNKLKGTNITPENILKIIPSIGCKWTGTYFSVSGNIEYMKTNFYKVGPIWLRLGFAYNLFLDNNKAIGKVIKWY